MPRGVYARKTDLPVTPRGPAVVDRDGLTLDEIGEILGVSRERIRQIEKKALGKLRKALEAEGMSFEDLFVGANDSE